MEKPPAVQVCQGPYLPPPILWSALLHTTSRNGDGQGASAYTQYASVQPPPLPPAPRALRPCPPEGSFPSDPGADSDYVACPNYTATLYFEKGPPTGFLQMAAAPERKAPELLPTFTLMYMNNTVRNQQYGHSNSDS